MAQKKIQVNVNGQDYQRWVDTRQSLGDFLREDLNLTGTHLGCEQGACGACTILVNGKAARSCLMFAVQCDGGQVVTVEGLARRDGPLHAIQSAFLEHHGFQCGFCTPGFLFSTYELLAQNPNPTLEEIKEGLSGNICRCTGYQQIVESVLSLKGTNVAAPQGWNGDD